MSPVASGCSLSHFVEFLEDRYVLDADAWDTFGHEYGMEAIQKLAMGTLISLPCTRAISEGRMLVIGLSSSWPSSSSNSSCLIPAGGAV
jgi:hypothetical protein